MKIRFGFVSNSSTTSFCLYGGMIDDKEDKDGNSPAENKIKEMNSFLQRKMTQGYGDWDNNVMIGLPPESIKDDETGAEFKKRVEDEIRRVFGDILGEDFSCSWYTTGWYNG